MKKIITFLILLFIPLFFVNAASVCSYKEQTDINKKIANIKIRYEILQESFTTETERPGNFDYVNISIVNLSEEFYIKTTNKTNSKEKTFTIADATDGIINYRWDDVSQITNFTFEIYTNDLTGCPDEKFKTVYLTTPRFNRYAKRGVCIENPDFEYCKTYTTNPNEINEEDFLEKLDKFTTAKNQKEKPNEMPQQSKNIFDTLLAFLNKSKWIILSIAIISVGIIIIIKKIKGKKRTKDLEL